MPRMEGGWVKRHTCRSLGEEHSMCKDKQMKSPGKGEYLACGKSKKGAIMAAAKGPGREMLKTRPSRCQTASGFAGHFRFTLCDIRNN